MSGGPAFYARIKTLVTNIESYLSTISGKVTICNTAATVANPAGLVVTLTTYTRSVVSAGTPVALAATALPAWRVDIVARPTNTGKICVGDASVHGTNLRIAELAAGESYCIECPLGARLDLATVFIDATVAGEGVFLNVFTSAVSL